VIEVFTTPYCPKCERVKALLRSDGIEYVEYNATTPSVVADLLAMQIFDRAMPVIVYSRDPVRYVSARDLPETDRELLAILRYASSAEQVVA